MVREPAYCTATGKVLLAGLAPEELDDYLLAVVQLQAFTPATIINRAQLRQQIAKVRSNGFAQIVWAICFK